MEYESNPKKYHNTVTQNQSVCNSVSASFFIIIYIHWSYILVSRVSDSLVNMTNQVPRSLRLSVGFGPAADPQFLYAPLIAYDEGSAEEAPFAKNSAPVSWYVALCISMDVDWCLYVL